MKQLEDYVLAIPDFPKEGIIFRDITTVCGSADGLQLSIDGICQELERQGIEFDAVAGLESRGFIFGTPVAYKYHKPFVCIRKKGKLPRECVSRKYELEYGTAEIEMHKDAIKPGDRVLIVDDLIATGGSFEASASLVEELGGTVAALVCIIELEGLKGRERLKGYNLISLVKYGGK